MQCNASVNVVNAPPYRGHDQNTSCESIHNMINGLSNEKHLEKYVQLPDGRVRGSGGRERGRWWGRGVVGMECDMLGVARMKVWIRSQPAFL